MEIKIHVDVHIHVARPEDLQPAIDQINKMAADEKAKTDNLNTALKDAESGTP
jgi:hypothetical protein